MEQIRNRLGRGAMPVDLTIENVPDDLAARLRERAARNGRSLEDELLAILVAAVGPLHLTIDEVYAEAEGWASARPASL